MVNMAEVYVASAFSKDHSGGNKAGVVIRDYHLTAAAKTALAAELGYSETAFLGRSETADFKLEYFTPTEEVPMCGHATIGTFTVLNHLGMLNKPHYTIETRSGILNITIRGDGMIIMEQNRPVFYDILDRSVLKNCFDIRCISERLPVQIVSTGLKDILIPVDSPEHLRELSPDFAAISDLSRDKGVVGMHAFSLVNDGTVTAVCRNFAPLYGIDEESATGTSNCALACCLFRNGQRQQQYVFEQGHNLNNISRIMVTVDSQGDTITKVFAGGYGYLDERKILSTSPDCT